MDNKVLIGSLEESKHYALQQTLSEKHGAFLARMHKFLVACGWKRTDDSRQSAMFHKVYTRDQRTIYLTGWHGGGKPGTSRNYGNLKLVFGLGDNQPEGKGPRDLYPKERFTLDIINGNVGDAEAFLSTVEKYLLTTCTR